MNQQHSKADRLMDIADEYFSSTGTAVIRGDYSYRPMSDQAGTQIELAIRRRLPSGSEFLMSEWGAECRAFLAQRYDVVTAYSDNSPSVQRSRDVIQLPGDINEVNWREKVRAADLDHHEWCDQCDWLEVNKPADNETVTIKRDIGDISIGPEGLALPLRGMEIRRGFTIIDPIEAAEPAASVARQAAKDGWLVVEYSDGAWGYTLKRQQKKEARTAQRWLVADVHSEYAAARQRLEADYLSALKHSGSEGFEGGS